MRPVFHPHLLNGPFGDPVVYVDFLYERRALLFDLGEIPGLEPRRILRLTHVFVSHAHMDHFMGFDRILRVRLGRPQGLELLGPPGLADRVEHKLASYTWNLVRNYAADFTISVSEIAASGRWRRARFRCRNSFRREEPARDVPRERSAASSRTLMLLDDDAFEVRAVQLDHRIPCLAFAMQEKEHINIWKNRLDALKLPTGPWLRDLKAAVRRSEPDATPVRVWWRERGAIRETHVPLGVLREQAVRREPGQKIAFVVDAAHHADNADRIVELIRGADVAFMEAAFLHADAERAARTCHLTARQAGLLARRAGVQRLVPMHFSTRYSGERRRLEEEAAVAFAGR